MARAHCMVGLVVVAACESSPSTPSSESSGAPGSETSAGDSTSSTGPITTTSVTTTFTTSSADESSSTGFEPSGPRCSVEYVTHDVLVDPLARGDQAGVFPSVIADVLEDNCGCHTLMDGGQNLEWPAFQAPGGALFLAHGDLARAFEDGTLGQAIETQVRGYTMPVGSCPHPATITDLLIPWFDQGMPDGATYMP